MATVLTPQELQRQIEETEAERQRFEEQAISAGRQRRAMQIGGGSYSCVSWLICHDMGQFPA